MTIALYVVSFGEFGFGFANLMGHNYILAACGATFSFLFFHLARKGWPFGADIRKAVLSLRLISITGAIMAIDTALDAKYLDAAMSCLMALVWFVAARNASRA